MNIIKNIFQLIILLMVASLVFPVDELETDNEAWALYTFALEKLIENNDAAALQLFKEFLEKYPDSPLRSKVEEYIDILENTLDHSAIVSFYITQLLSTTYVAFTLPQLFGADMETDSLIYGIAGITGVGAGLASAWLMTKDDNMSLGQDIWIENLMVLSIVNYNLLWALFSDEFLYENKLYLSGQLALVTGSRIGSYFLFKDKLPSSGRASFCMWSYIWTHFYTWMGIGISESEDIKVNSTLALIIPNLSGVGSFFLWDQLNWSFERNGLISISGIGGILVGVFINLVLDSLVETQDQRVAMGIIMGSACIGTGCGIFFTSGMTNETIASSTHGNEKSKNDIRLLVTPVSDGNGLGFHILYSY